MNDGTHSSVQSQDSLMREDLHEFIFFDKGKEQNKAIYKTRRSLKFGMFRKESYNSKGKATKEQATMTSKKCPSAGCSPCEIDTGRPFHVSSCHCCSRVLPQLRTLG